jgi:hypothetical protein
MKGGGHGVAGKAVCDGGLIIDPSRTKSIRVDPHGAYSRMGRTETAYFHRDLQYDVIILYG